MILPTFALGVKFAAVIQRQTRAALRDTLKEDYIRTAWSKGLKERQVVIKHALRNSIIPVLTIIGMQIGRLFGGAVTIEIIFRIPGMGRLAVDSVLFRDFRMVQGVMIVIGCAVVLTNFLTDILYVYFNPRIRYK
jgi:ABC-type dipeptide/oligopeptide/nickel transport system permease component